MAKDRNKRGDCHTFLRNVRNDRTETKEEIAADFYEVLAKTRGDRGKERNDKKERKVGFLNFKKSNYNLTDEKEKNARGK